MFLHRADWIAEDQLQEIVCYRCKSCLLYTYEIIPRTAFP